jgi:hypothetical protein
LEKVMKTADITPETRSSENAFRLISYVLVALMLACAVTTVLNLAIRILPDWRPWYMVGICFVVALDSFYSRHIFKHLSFFSSEWLSLASTQVIVLFITLRLVIGFSHGLEAFSQEIAAGPLPFVLSFFSSEFLMATGIMAITWTVCLSFGSLFDEMGLDAELARQDDCAAVPKEGRPPRERLLSLIFNIGIFLVIVTALLRLDFRATLAGDFASAILHVSPLANGGGSTLLYFMFALVLFSETQFILLHTRWSLQRIPISTTMAGRWALYSLIFLALLIVLASLLPTDYSLGFLATMGYVIDLLARILFSIAQFIISLLIIITNLPFLLFGKPAPFASQATKPGAMPLPEPATSGEMGTPFPWVEVMRSVLFWMLFLILAGFALSQYLRQHEEVLNALRKIPGTKWLTKFWSWLQGAFQKAQKGIADTISANLQRLRPRRSLAQAMGGWINLRRLGPRQRIFFFYQAFLRRSGESGLPRHPSQTPLEFASRLDSAIPEAEPDIDALTGAFVEARYTPRPVEPEKASRVKGYWEHFKKILRGKRVEEKS